MILITRETGETVTLDITTRQASTFSATVTEHPIEDGSSTADHSQRQSPSFAIEARLYSSASLVGRPDPDLVGVEGRDRRIVDTLRSINRSGELVTVTDADGTVENVVIDRVTDEVRSPTETSVSLGLRQIRIAVRQTVSIPPLRPTEAASVGAPDETDTGQQPTDNPESPQEAEESSVLYSILDTFGWT